MDKVKMEMEQELYRELDEDYGKKLIYKMARERNKDSKDIITGSVIKDKKGKLVTDRKYVLQIFYMSAANLRCHARKGVIDWNVSLVLTAPGLNRSGRL